MLDFVFERGKVVDNLLALLALLSVVGLAGGTVDIVNGLGLWRI